MKIDYPNLSLLIGGYQVVGDEWRDIVNPADLAVVGRYPVITPAQLDTTVEQAHAAFLSWRKSSPVTRSEVLLCASRWLGDHVAEIATAITLEQGKPLAQARAEVARAREIIEWDAGEARRLYGRVIPSERGMRHTVIRKPYGVVAAFSPWNYPISNAVRKVSGAVAAGCGVILKPAEETPAGGYYLAQAFIEAGVPAGLVSLVTGVPDRISSQLIADERIRLVAFTGSTAVGKSLTALAGQHMKPVIMELGGHAPVIVCEDADPVAAAKAGLVAKSRNAGQICTAVSRFFVHESLYEKFTAEFAFRGAALRMGPGILESTELGPLANARRVAAMERLVQDAISKGAKLVCGGQRTKREGHFYPLTVLGNVPDDAAAMQEEPFGPLALVTPYRTLDEAIRRANAIPFALSAYAFTDSSRNVYQLTEELECGNLSINHLVGSVAETPFGGIKQSGIGREGGSEGVAAYTYVKCISQRTFLAEELT